MQQRGVLAAAALMVSLAAHAEHFSYQIGMDGIAEAGGTQGCFPPFDQPACPRPAHLSGLMSFDTPGSGDGTFSVVGSFGDITNFYVDLGFLPYEDLYGGVQVIDGLPAGGVQSNTGMELFSFDWGARTVSYSYDFGYHGASGKFTGTLFAVPEPATTLLMLAGLAGIAARGRIRSNRSGDQTI